MQRDPTRALQTLGDRVQGVGRVLAGSAFATVPVPYLTGLLFLGGMIVLARSRCSSSGWRDPPAVLLMCSCVMLVGVTLWIPMDWDRYYLPVIAILSVTIGALGRPLNRAARRR